MDRLWLCCAKDIGHPTDLTIETLPVLRQGFRFVFADAVL